MSDASNEANAPVKDLRVRTATLSDAFAVERVLASSYPVQMALAYDRNLLARALPLITKANPALLSSGTYYVAEAADQIVGCGGWSLEEPGSNAITPGTAHIRHFAVMSEWLGRGIGRALLNRCEADARAKCIRVLKCFASRNAVGFYSALGFLRRSDIATEMPGGIAFPSVLMELRLSSELPSERP